MKTRLEELRAKYGDGSEEMALFERAAVALVAGVCALGPEWRCRVELWKAGFDVIVHVGVGARETSVGFGAKMCGIDGLWKMLAGIRCRAGEGDLTAGMAALEAAFVAYAPRPVSRGPLPLPG